MGQVRPNQDSNSKPSDCKTLALPLTLPLGLSSAAATEPGIKPRAGNETPAAVTEPRPGELRAAGSSPHLTVTGASEERSSDTESGFSENPHFSDCSVASTLTDLPSICVSMGGERCVGGGSRLALLNPASATTDAAITAAATNPGGLAAPMLGYKPCRRCAVLRRVTRTPCVAGGCCLCFAKGFVIIQAWVVAMCLVFAGLGLVFSETPAGGFACLGAGAAMLLLNYALTKWITL